MITDGFIGKLFQQIESEMTNYPAYQLMLQEQQTEREKRQKQDYKNQLGELRNNYYGLADRFRALFQSTKEIDELREKVEQTSIPAIEGQIKMKHLIQQLYMELGWSFD